MTNPVTDAVTVVARIPETVDGVAETVEPYAVVKPYSKITEAAALFAFTVPFSVTPLEERAVTAAVVTVGAITGVVKV